MNAIILCLFFLIIVLAIAVVPPVIRAVVLKVKGDGPVLVKHEYTKQSGRFFYELKMTVWHYRIMERALVCNMRYRLADVNKQEIQETAPAVPGEEVPSVPAVPHITPEQQCLREEWWTNAATTEILERGYKPVERLHDTLLWWRVPTYLMMADVYKFDVPDDKTKYPQHTPALLDNMFKSQAFWKFLKGLTTKIAARDMDVHAIIMVLVIIAGCVGGLWVMGYI